MNTRIAPDPQQWSTETDEERGPLRSSTARSRELGEELRRIRHRAQKSSVDIAEALGWSQGKLSKLETGSRGSGAWEVAALVGRLGADKPTRDRILAIVSDPGTKDFLRPYDRIPDTLVALSLHERLALTITAYEPLTVPSLVQTEDYARALTGDAALARTRIGRQNALDDGTETTVYVHEAALRVAVGGPAVMRDQLLQLTLMCGWARSSPRLVPMSVPFHPAIRNPATLLTFTHPYTPLAYVETDTAAVFHEERDAVARYQSKMHHLDSLALSPVQSHDVFASWADRYDRETH